MTKWLCVWQKDSKKGGYRDVDFSTKASTPASVILALGFDPQSAVTRVAECTADGPVLLKYLRFHSCTGDGALVLFDGLKGDKTHLVHIRGILPQHDAANWLGLDRLHNRFPISYQSTMVQELEEVLEASL